MKLPLPLIITVAITVMVMMATTMTIAMTTVYADFNTNHRTEMHYYVESAVVNIVLIDWRVDNLDLSQDYLIVIQQNQDGVFYPTGTRAPMEGGRHSGYLTAENEHNDPDKPLMILVY